MTQALDAAGAMTHISKSLPDLIILDWVLPGSSGIELARHLRTNQRTSNIPIIMLSARNSESDKIFALEAGADDYVTKPFSPRELMARIRAKLRNRELQISDGILCGELELSLANYRVRAKGTAIETREKPAKQPVPSEVEGVEVPVEALETAPAVSKKHGRPRKGKLRET